MNNSGITKDYLSQLKDYEIVEPSKELMGIDIKEYARIFKINKIVYNKDENMIEKFITVINAVFSSGASIVTIIKSIGIYVDYYIGVVNKNSSQDVVTQASTFNGVFTGNFAGSKIEMMKNSVFENIENEIFDDEFNSQCITSISGIGSLRKKGENEIKNYVQGIENMVDSLRGQSYTAIVVADPISYEKVSTIRQGYEQLYSQLSPFAKTDLTFNDSDTLSMTHSSTKGFTDTINTSLAYTQNHSETCGWNTSESTGTSRTKSPTAVIGTLLVGGATIVLSGGLAAVPMVTLAGGAGGAIGAGLGGTNTETENSTLSKNASTNESSAISNTNGESRSNLQQESDSTGETQTRGRSIQISSENRTVKTLLEKIDGHIERLKMCENYGTFNCAAYVISSNVETNTMVASSYNALMRGEESSMQASHINTWDQSKTSDIRRLKEYISRFTHPIFQNEDFKSEIITPASIVNGQELAVHLGLPKKSISGVAVVESASFGRNIFKLSDNKSNDSFNIGCLYHMGIDEEMHVNLDVKSMTMHTFVTGSTGSGKSNTIYNILSELGEKRVKFLVVEPSKGEYKNIFGFRKDVNVFGTNPYITQLLKINPFKFPNEIHVLEHIDKLIEIFNVCWPMYAAMPAVLKDAVLQAYEVCGWDLIESKNRLSDGLFPTFADLQNELVSVIESSAYSQELKSNYTGSLITRVKSLTNGLNGQIFSAEEIDNQILFDENVIVDLSRIGSLETKALIMGILVMRLNEYRMSEADGMNAPLKHVTVLEEAHNILKRTSTEQNSEAPSVAGKSVEMLSNAIAEMRTYGEGFIIADQSPSAVDISAIRNTNTKIIMRLPDESDRRLAGKSAALTDEQLEEIAKLPRGVAVVYQNDWIEPVLCKIRKFDGDEVPYQYEYDTFEKNDIKMLKKEILLLLLKERTIEQTKPNIDLICNTLDKSDISTKTKIGIYSLIDEYKSTSKLRVWKDSNFKVLSGMVTELIANKGMIQSVVRSQKTFEELNSNLLKLIDNTILGLSDEIRLTICQCFMKDYSGDDSEKIEIYSAWRETMCRGGEILL
jgi:DNA helicase HerA-like ATPase